MITEFGKLGGSKNRNGRCRAETKRARGAQDRVDHHRDKGRVKPYLNWQSGDGGVGQGFRDNDRCSRYPGNDIESEPLARIAGQPS